MIINRTDNVDFSGIYRIRNTQKNIQDIQKHVIPMYEYLKKEPMLIFYGSNPFKMVVDDVINLTAKLNGSTAHWVRMNATIHNLDVVDKQEDFVHVVSSKKDVFDVMEYMQGRLNQRNSFIEKLKIFFKKNQVSDVPEHLKLLAYAINENKKDATAFEEFLNEKNKKIVMISTPQELLTKIFTER